MFRLNDNGWGFGMFLVYMFIFLIAILMIIAVSSNLDLELSNLNDNDVERDKQNEKLQYLNYEMTVEEASSLYSNEKLNNISNGDVFYVDINNLDVSIIIKSECSGYSRINKKNGNIYHNAYLKCDNYVTSGYDSKVLE